MTGLPKLRRIVPPEDVGGGLERYAEIDDGTGASAYRLKQQPREKKKMVKGKKVAKGVKTGKSKTESPTVKNRKVAGPIAGIGSRTCSTCGKKGHNARSHYPGGKLAKR